MLVGGSHQPVGGSHQQAAGVGRCQPRQRIHVPAVVIGGEHPALGGQQMKGRQLYAGDAVHRPAVALVRLHIAAGQTGAGRQPLPQRTEVHTRRRRFTGSRQRRRKGMRGGRAGGSVLRDQQAAGLCRPRHQLAVQQQPVRFQFAPQIRRVHCRPHPFQQ